MSSKRNPDFAQATKKFQSLKPRSFRGILPKQISKINVFATKQQLKFKISVFATMCIQVVTQVFAKLRAKQPPHKFSNQFFQPNFQTNTRLLNKYYVAECLRSKDYFLPKTI